MKKFMVMILALCLVFSSGMTAFAATGYEAEATELKTMGLFQGTDKGFELEVAPTRAQASVMLVRFLGKEDIALAQSSSHPFTDVPKWADKYIGYLYANNLTNGVSDKLFGANNSIDAKSYSTYLLRSLGYDDSKGDFTWKEAEVKAVTVGLMTEAERVASESSNFLRGNMVHQSYSALSVKYNNTEETLKDMLMVDKSTDLPNPPTPVKDETTIFTDDSFAEDTDYISVKAGSEEFYNETHGIGWEGERIGISQTQVNDEKNLSEIYFSKGYDLVSTPEQTAWMFMDFGFTKPLKNDTIDITFYSPDGNKVATKTFEGAAGNKYFAFTFTIDVLREIIDTNKYGYVYFKETVYAEDGEALEIGGRLGIVDIDNPVLQVK
ncbi:MAG: S-layer homology domain-containing protein [Peptostreptococcaceae bacterium]|nr:S-layer homology domain-containing protein [Peptostreptococcaceae bacterium]